MSVCVAHKLLQVSKQGQNKMQASYVRKYLKNKDDFDNFEKWQLTFRSWKTGKSHGKSCNLKRVRTLIWNNENVSIAL